MTKLPKAEVAYTPKAKMPDERCARCTHFYFYLPDGQCCTRVEGDISPNGWCKLFKNA